MSAVRKNHFRHLNSAAKSDIGRKRKNNEDSFGAFPSFGVWCVADGMGGGDDGEVASAAVIRSMDVLFNNLAVPISGAYAGKDVCNAVCRAIEDASSWIYKRTQKRNLKGCGSTCVGVIFDATDPKSAYSINIGDSRLYRLRGRDLKQITRDHSVSEMMGSKHDEELNPMFRSMILRAVGVEATADIEVKPFPVREGDILLICSDGLTRMVPDNLIAEIIRREAGNPDKTVDELIAAANAAGGIDNITVEIIEVGALPPAMVAVPMTEGDADEGDGPQTMVTRGKAPSARPTTAKSDLSAALSKRGLLIGGSAFGAIALAALVFALMPSAPAPVTQPEVKVVTEAEPPKQFQVVERPKSVEKTEAQKSWEDKKTAIKERLLQLKNKSTENVAAEDDELKDAITKLEAQRERRMRETFATAELERERRDAALELADTYYPGENFSNFANYVHGMLGRGEIVTLAGEGRKLNLRRHDADIANTASEVSGEIIRLCGVIADRLEQLKDATETERRLMKGCRVLQTADPASAEGMRQCVKVMSFVSTNFNTLDERWRKR